MKDTRGAKSRSAHTGKADNGLSGFSAVFQKLRKNSSGRGIQVTIMTALTTVTLVLLVSISVILYARFSLSSRAVTVENAQNVMEQTQANLEDYLRSMRQISDAANFNVISEYSADDPTLERELGLIYESYKDRLVSIALYNGNGSLLAAAPTATQKTDPNVTAQTWFQDAMDRIENMHFSTPHVQNLFDDATGRYHWVISLSRAVDLGESSTTKMGVLLVDMSYSAVSSIMERVNENSGHEYFYLCDQNGQIIYHPEKIRISEELYEEDSSFAAARTDGVYEDRLNGERRTLVVQSIAYTGWKLVGVIPYRSYVYGDLNLAYFVILLLILMLMMLLAVNRVVSARISRPILRLNNSVRAYEAGEKPEIYIGGSTEIRHLGSSIQKSYEQIDALMKQIVEEQTERRRSELDALQSQINPHFLYNTLDSITWMVEGGRNREAVSMISELAKLLRISISKGHSIIRVADELQHAKSYMAIQRFRYKDRFAVRYEIDPAVEECCCVKLIVQPILENAIYYGVGDMDEDDGGEILLRAKLEPAETMQGAVAQTADGRKAEESSAGDPAEIKERQPDPSGQDPADAEGRLSAAAGAETGGREVVIQVRDNGLGMTAEEAAHVLTNDNIVHKHGSGVGLVNVNRRIQLMFGRQYGLQVESEPDLGTTVTIRFPAVAFTEENQRTLEQGGARSEE